MKTYRCAIFSSLAFFVGILVAWLGANFLNNGEKLNKKPKENTGAILKPPWRYKIMAFRHFVIPWSTAYSETSNNLMFGEPSFVDSKGYAWYHVSDLDPSQPEGLFLVFEYNSDRELMSIREVSSVSKTP